MSHKHFIKRGKWYHFKKRIPSHCLEKFVPKRTHIQIPLKTDSEEIAIKRAYEVEKLLEDYWMDIENNGIDNEMSRFKEVINRLFRLGFEYKPYKEIITDTSNVEFVNRIHTAHQEKTSDQKKAVLGILPKPEIKILDTFKFVEQHEYLKLSQKNEKELKNWKNPILKALTNFATLSGNLPVHEITREHIFEFRQWWVGKIIEEELTVNSANKDITFLKKCIQITSDTLNLSLPIGHLFDGIRLKVSDSPNDKEGKPRPPYSQQWIKSVLVQHKYRFESKECEHLIKIMINTGCRIKELTGIDVSNRELVLHHEIPHIIIQKNDIRNLKTKTSERIIPLAGIALEAFKQMDGGFIRYLGKSDAISAAINKYMLENGLRESEKHVLYSLRHSFEDRLEKLKAPEKTMAYLMGHSYSRQRYGDPPTLENNLEWILKISF